MITLYDILGVEKTASLGQIKRAYKAKAKLHHPDAGGKADDMAAINQAHDILSDPDSRKEYDETGVIIEWKKVEEDAKNFVASKFGEYVEKVVAGNGFTMGVLGYIRNQVEEHRRKHDQEMRKLEKILDTLDVTTKNLKVKEGEPDTLKPCFEVMRRSLASQRAKLRFILASSAKAAAILDEYEQLGEARPMSPGVFHVVTNISSTAGY